MSAGEYFYRFIGDEIHTSPEYTELRNRLAGIHPGYHQDDSSVDGEVTDADAENPARDPYVEYVVKSNGLDVTDPFSVAKANPHRKTYANLRVDGLSDRELKALSQAREKIESEFTSGLLTKYTSTEAGIATIDSSLDRYRFIGKPQLRAGVNYTGHLSNVLAVMAKATKDLEIGAYQMEHPTVMSMIMDMSKTVQTNITLNNPFGLGPAAELGAAYLKAKAGGNLNLDLPNTNTRWDHFKFYASNLGRTRDPIDRSAVFMITSANATMAAMGRPTRRGASFATNLEASFVLDYSLVKSGQIQEKVYDSLIKQARSARDWIRSGNNIAPDFGSDLEGTKLVGTGQTWLEHQRLLQRAKSGDVIRIVNFEIGDTYIGQLAEAIKRGASVEIIHGVPHIDSNSNVTQTDEVLNRLRNNYELDGSALARIKTIRSPGFVHAKMAIYSLGTENILMLGSTNLTGGMLRGHHIGLFGRSGRLDTRDLDIMLSSKHAPSIVGEQISKFNSLYFGAEIFGKSSAFRDWDTSQLDKLTGALDARGDYYTTPDLARVSRLIDAKTGNLYGAQITLGGQYAYYNRAGKLSRLSMGDLYTFSVTQKIAGFDNQLYIPELAKSIGPVRGLSSGSSMDFDTFETIAAGVSRMNSFIGEVIKAFSEHTTYDVQDLARSGYIRGRFRSQLRAAFRDTFKNFEGIEQGLPVYNAKSHARLNFGLDPSGRLSLYPFNIPKLDVTNIEYSRSRMFRDYLDGLYSGLELESMGIKSYDIDSSIYRPSGVSKSMGSATSAARTFALSGFAGSLSISAKLSDDDYFFALPISKIIQLAQRVGNIMSARAMISPDKNYSLLTPQDGKLVEGMRVKGYMALGLGGDIAYVDSGSMPEGKFGLPYRKEVKVRNATIDPTSLDSIKRELLRLKGLNKGYVIDKGSGKYEITTSGLDYIKHRVPVFDTISEGLGGRVTQYLELPTIKHAGAAPSMLLDIANMSASFRGGMFVMDLPGETQMHLQTGARMMVGIKDPMIFTEPGARLFSEIDRLSTIAGDSFTGMSGTKLVFGSSGVKTGEILLQTGLELIKSGSTDKLLLDMGINSLDDRYTKLFERFDQYLDPAVKALISEPMSAATMKSLFARTATALRSGSISIGQTEHVATAFLAFGLHATSFLNRLRQHNLSLGSMDDLPMGIQEFIPVYGVIPVAANNTIMSSRNRVNFLNYHAGQYTDAFMDIMGMDPRVQSRAKAFTEILGSGLLHSTSSSEVLVAGLDVSPMTGYLTSIHKDFVEATALTRFMENKTSSLTKLSPEDLTNKLADLHNRIQNKIGTPQSSYVVGNYDAAYITSYLQAEKASGIGARTLLVPELGKWSVGPLGRRFVFDQSSKQASMREVRLVSPESLLAIGDFDYYTHEVARLQVELLERLPDMMDVFKGGKVTGLSTYKRRLYDDFMQLVGSLEEAQAQLAATDFQKMIGGQMAISGYNMVVGTHAELPAGYMVLGDEPFKQMRSAAVSEMIRSVGQKDMFATAEKLAKKYGIEPTAKVKALLEAKLGPDSTLRNLGPKLDRLGKSYLRHVAEQLIDNPMTRHEFMPGMYQRAGAPMGPMGVNGATIITAREFNERFGQWAPIDESRFNRSVMLSYGGMMFNLGDFDGDTMSVARVSRYAGFAMLDMLGKLSDPDSKAVYSAVRSQLDMDIRERSILFAKQYIGGSPLFKESSLYSTLAGLELDKAKQYLRGLKRKESSGQPMTAEEVYDLNNFERRLQSAYDLSIGAVSFAKDIYGVTIDIENYVMERAGVDRETALQEILHRKTAASRRIYDKHLNSVTATLADTSKGLDINASRLTSDEVSAVIAASAYAGTVLIGKTFESAFAVQTYFGSERASATGRIASELYRKGFKATQSRNIIELARADMGSQKVRDLVYEYDIHNQQFEKIQTLVLITQQMARDAIKPKLDYGAIGELRAAIQSGKGSVTSGIMFVKGQARTKALEAFQSIVNSTELYENLDYSRFSQLHKTLRTGFESYLLDQSMGIFAMAGDTSADYIQALISKDESGRSLLTSEELSSIDPAFKGLATGNPAELQLSPDQVKKLVDNHLKVQAKHFADLAMTDIFDSDVASYRRDYLDYATALNSSNPDRFFDKISGIDPVTKLKIFAGMTARGAIRSHRNMGLAIEDILMDWSSADDLKQAASIASDSQAFADNMHSIYNLSNKMGSPELAVSHMQRSISVRPLQLDQEIANISREKILTNLQTRSVEEQAELDQLSQSNKDKDLEALQEERARWRSLHKIREALGIRSFDATSTESVSRVHQAAESFNRLMETKSGQKVDHMFKNTLLPGLFIGAITVGAFSSPDAQAQTMVTAAAMISPLNISKSLYGDPNASVRGGIIAASLGAGTIGAIYSSKLAKGMLGHSLDHMGTGLAGVAGATVVGLATGLVLESLARKFNLIREINPIPQAIGALVGTSVEQFSQRAESTDEIEQEAGFSTEDQVVWEATGEVLGFWPQDTDAINADVDVSVDTYDEATTDSSGFTSIKDYFTE